MKRLSPHSSRRGVALVITLIMLSVVTITAVSFLMVARRERAAVAAAGEQADARIAAAGDQPALATYQESLR